MGAKPFTTLPGTVNAIADVVGIDAALKLVEAVGGSSIAIPHAIPETHLLVQILGFDQARQLAKRFGGEVIGIPRCKAFLNALRDDQIRQHRAAGAPIRDLCIKFSLSARQINTICGPRA